MKKIYQLICLIYCKIFTLLENKIYKKLAIISDSELLDKGYELIKLMLIVYDFIVPLLKVRDHKYNFLWFFYL